MSNIKRYSRKQTPPSMRFQNRDGEILQTIQKFDGVMARRQIKKIFWSTASEQAMRYRLSLLYHNGFLNMPNDEQRQVNPIPEPIVWLGWRGILFIAREQGFEIESPKSSNENRLRKLEKDLREIGIRWQ